MRKDLQMDKCCELDKKGMLKIKNGLPLAILCYVMSGKQK